LAACISKSAQWLLITSMNRQFFQVVDSLLELLEHWLLREKQYRWNNIKEVLIITISSKLARRVILSRLHVFASYSILFFSVLPWYCYLEHIIDTVFSYSLDSVLLWIDSIFFSSVYCLDIVLVFTVLTLFSTAQYWYSFSNTVLILLDSVLIR
jgi:hypothetical protein